MSYCRMSEGSDLYIYEDVTDGLMCCGCPLIQPWGSFRCGTPAEMLEHIKEHQAKGDSVPQHAIDRLTEEANQDARS